MKERKRPRAQEPGPRAQKPGPRKAAPRKPGPRKAAPRKPGQRAGPRARTPALTIRPVTPDRWPDLEAVFQAKGCSIARGCWCMFYRRSGGSGWQIGGSRSEANRADLKALVDSNRQPGLIAYRGKEPVGWVTLGPREDFKRLERSIVMKAVDDKPVWSIICFVVPSAHRRQGVAHALLEGAIDYARKRGAALLEAYPVDKAGLQSNDSLWFGSKSMYDRAGFKEVARRKPTRPVVRRKIAAS